jgi:hypothetical protein
MDMIFLIAAAILVLAFLLFLFLPEIPLRTQSAMSAREGAPDPALAAGPAPGVGAVPAAGAVRSAGPVPGVVLGAPSPDGPSTTASDAPAVASSNGATTSDGAAPDAAAAPDRPAGER